jgi:hypothetical protein
MSRRLPRRILLTSLLVVVAAPIGGAANAYWSGSGGGAGSGTSGAAVAVTLSPGTPAATLYPGGQANVVLTVSNPNANPVRIGSLSLDTSQGLGTGFAVDSGHSGCAVSTLSFTTQTNAGAGWVVPAKVLAVNGTLPITLTNALALGVGAANACQGATYTVYLTAGP